MLVACGHASLYRAAIRAGFVFGRGIWCKLIEQERLAYDTQYLPGASGAPKARVCVYLLVAGEMETRHRVIERFEAPRALVMTHEQLEGAQDRRSLTFRAGGERCAVIELHLESDQLARELSLPETVDVPPAVWGLAESALANISRDEDRAKADVADLLRELATDGLLHADAVARATAPSPALLEQMWRGVKPLLERVVLSTTAGDIAERAGLTGRRTEEGMQRLIGRAGLVGTGMRAVMNRLRLKTAVIFLSAEDGSMAEVAQIAGFGSADAMARAFRNAGLPAPSVVRDALTRST